ncbi:MAG TPA: PAS domain S-box protein [Methanocella sp.]|nr:PAS domain S-box protein [Methanocella sp.]
MDVRDKDKLKNRIAILEDELILNVRDASSTGVADRKRAEEALLESETRFRSVLENSVDCVYRFNVQTGRYEYISPSCKDIVGYTPGELMALDLAGSLAMLHPEDVSKLRLAQAKCVETGKARVEYRQQDKSGDYRWISNHMSLIRDGEGMPLYRDGNLRDITERIWADEVLRESDRRFRAIFDQTLQFIGLLAVDGVLLEANDAALAFIGAAAESEVVGKLFWDTPWWIHSPEIQARLQQAVKKAANGEIDRFEATHRAHDGRLSYFDFSLKPVVDENGNVILLIPEGRDITERRRSEEALRRSEEKFRSFVDESVDGIVIFSGEGRILESNRGYESILGISKGDLVDRYIWDVQFELMVPERRDMINMETLKRGMQGILASDDPERWKQGGEYTILRPDGQLRTIQMNSFPVGTSAGRLMGAIVRDVTERRRAEEALRESEERRNVAEAVEVELEKYRKHLEDLVQQRTQDLEEAKAQAELYLDLMGHDINNMHQISMGYLEVARGMPERRLQEEMIDKSIEVLQRSTQLIQNVRKLQMVHEGVFKSQDIDVVKVLADVQREFGVVPYKAVTLRLNGRDSYHVQANELLHDVIVNLVSNAIKHTGDKADIGISLDTVDDESCHYCQVSVEDNGPGVPNDSKERIFNRMRKGTARGMGLGLYIVKTLVESYSGRVWVEDRVPGDHTKGAKFVVMLPTIKG